MNKRCFTSKIVYDQRTVADKTCRKNLQSNETFSTKVDFWSFPPKIIAYDEFEAEPNKKDMKNCVSHNQEDDGLIIHAFST